MDNTIPRLTAPLFPMLVATAAALGQSEPEAKATDRTHINVTPQVSHAFSADVDSTPGDVAVTRASLGLSILHQPSDKLALSLEVLPEWSWYDFNGTTGLTPASDDPVDDVFRLNLRPGAVFRTSDDWSLVGGAILQYAGEQGADFGDSLTFGGYAGVRHEFSDSLGATLGVAGRTRIEDDSLIVPLIGLDWKVSDKVTVFVEGLGGRVSARINDEVTFFLAGAWEPREYRLADDSSIPNGVIQDDQVAVWAGATWSPNKRVSATLYGGVVAAQEFTFRNAAGDEIATPDADPAPLLGLSLTLHF